MRPVHAVANILQPYLATVKSGHKIPVVKFVPKQLLNCTCILQPCLRSWCNHKNYPFQGSRKVVTFLRSRNAVVKCWSPWAIFYSCSISATELIGLMKMELVRYWRWPVMDWTESTKVNREREISGPLKLFPMVVTWARRLLRVNLLCIYILRECKKEDINKSWLFSTRPVWCWSVLHMFHKPDESVTNMVPLFLLLTLIEHIIPMCWRCTISWFNSSCLSPIQELICLFGCNVNSPCILYRLLVKIRSTF